MEKLISFVKTFGSAILLFGIFVVGGEAFCMNYDANTNPCENRSLSKPSNSEEFLGVHGAQDRRVLEAREDPSTGATQKLQEERRFRDRSNKNAAMDKHTTVVIRDKNTNSIIGAIVTNFEYRFLVVLNRPSGDPRAHIILSSAVESRDDRSQSADFRCFCHNDRSYVETLFSDSLNTFRHGGQGITDVESQAFSWLSFLQEHENTATVVDKQTGESYDMKHVANSGVLQNFPLFQFVNFYVHVVQHLHQDIWPVK
ncbi:MAG: hypothetical protein LBD81_00955 [Holosporaceae bacterium]|nr:hypothetical protein [Holosporaceae bacterium]